MSKYKEYSKVIKMPFMALLLAVFMAGCGSDNDNGGGSKTPPPPPIEPPVLNENPAPVLLGTAGDFVILAQTSIANTGTSAVTGDMGITPGFAAAITGFALTVDATVDFSTSAQVVGKIYAPDYIGGQTGSLGTTPAKMTTAQTDMTTAYNDAAGRTASSAATTNVGAGTLTSLTLTRGVYEWGTAVNIPTDLTLDGSATDVWIFKVAGTLDMAAAKNVILSGGALPQNIFWQVADVVTIGANTHFEGIILGQTAITFGNAASNNGRLLAQTAAILDTTMVTQPAP